MYDIANDLTTLITNYKKSHPNMTSEDVKPLIEAVLDPAVVTKKSIAKLALEAEAELRTLPGVGSAAFDRDLLEITNKIRSAFVTELNKVHLKPGQKLTKK